MVKPGVQLAFSKKKIEPIADVWGQRTVSNSPKHLHLTCLPPCAVVPLEVPDSGSESYPVTPVALMTGKAGLQNSSTTLCRQTAVTAVGCW